MGEVSKFVQRITMLPGKFVKVSPMLFGVSCRDTSSGWVWLHFWTTKRHPPIFQSPVAAFRGVLAKLALATQVKINFDPVCVWTAEAFSFDSGVTSIYLLDSVERSIAILSSLHFYNHVSKTKS